MEKLDIKNVEFKNLSPWIINNNASMLDFFDLTGINMPDEKKGKTMHGEVIRAYNRLVYEYYNNGYSNVINSETKPCKMCSGYDEECDYCFGEGEDISSINEYYLSLFIYLSNAFEKYFGDDVLPYTNDFLNTFSYKENEIKHEEIEKCINNLLDILVYFIKNTEDKPREFIKKNI